MADSVDYNPQYVEYTEYQIPEVKFLLNSRATFDLLFPIQVFDIKLCGSYFISSLLLEGLV